MIKLTHSSLLVWMEPQLEGNRFKWDAIVRMYKQECRGVNKFHIIL